MASIKETQAAINKKYGANTILTADSLPDVRKIALDIPAFDYVATGGFLVNHITEFYGPFSSLKSYLNYVALGKFQKYDWANNEPNAIRGVERDKKGNITKILLRRGYKPKNPPRYKQAAIVDLESSYVPSWGKRLGINNAELLHLRPGSVNDAVDMTEALLRSEDISFIFFDSMHIIGADRESDSPMDKELMAINAAFWNRATRKIMAAMNKNPENDITISVVNGFYDKMGMVFGDPETTKNGNQMQLARAVSFRTNALKVIKEGEIAVGRNVMIRNKKNKFGTPLLESSLYFSFIDDGELEIGETNVLDQLIDIGLIQGLIERAGNSYMFQSLKAVGAERFKKSLISNNMVDVLKEEVYKRINTVL